MEYMGYIAASNTPPGRLRNRAAQPSSSFQRASSTRVPSTSTKSRFDGGHRRTNSSDSAQSFKRLPNDVSSVRAQSSATPLSVLSSSLSQHQKRDTFSLLTVSDEHWNKALLPPLSPLLTRDLASDPLIASFSPISGTATTSTGGVLSPTVSELKRPTNKIRKSPPQTLESSGEPATHSNHRELSRDPYIERDGHDQGRHRHDKPLEPPSPQTPGQLQEAAPQKGQHHKKNVSFSRPLHFQLQQPNLPAPTNYATTFSNTSIANSTSHDGGAANMSAMSGSLALPYKAIDANESRNEAQPIGVQGSGSRGSSQSLLSTGSAAAKAKPYVKRNGRTYLSDPSLSYPLPVDIMEIHRQSLRTLLLLQLFGGPICSPKFAKKPPKRVLEVACGSAFWSIMCNDFFARQGHSGISFSGIDIAPLSQGLGKSGRDKGEKSAGLKAAPAADEGCEDRSSLDDMQWRFVQHDIRRYPWPLEAGEFDLIMLKDTSLTVGSDAFQFILDECIRLLEPGGTLEVWDSDHSIRLLRPHYQAAAGTLSPEEEKEHEAAANAGAYVVTPMTPLSAPQNPFIMDYNGWLQKAFENRSLPCAPCALASAFFLQEAESLTNASLRRLAIPLSEMRWEREGIGGVVTKDGKTYVESKGKPKPVGAAVGSGTDTEGRAGKRVLTAAQMALRKTALLTVVQMIQALGPVLREVNGKSQDAWNVWSGKLTNNLMRDNGIWGECLEVGAWWAEKR